VCLKAAYRKRAGRRGGYWNSWVPARQILCTGREIEGSRQVMSSETFGSGQWQKRDCRTREPTARHSYAEVCEADDGYGRVSGTAPAREYALFGGWNLINRKRQLNSERLCLFSWARQGLRGRDRWFER
jgi:hypothetical protein